MGQKSTIERLDTEIKEEIDRLIRDDQYTIDEILAHLRQLGDDDTSRSALGRYVKKTKDQMERFREAQAVAKTWIKRMEEEGPDGDVGRLVAEMLRTVAFQQVGNMTDKERNNPMDIMLIAKAIKDLAGADKLSTERIIKIRDEVAKQTAQKAADVVNEVAREGGLNSEQQDALYNRILGIVG